jgi:hypothetical protein
MNGLLRTRAMILVTLHRVDGGLSPARASGESHEQRNYAPGRSHRSTRLNQS